MKSFFLILALFFSTDKALSQDKKPCFSIPQAVNLIELDNINLTNDCLITSFSFQLFNRWGELMRETNKLTNPLNFGGNEPETTKKKKIKHYVVKKRFYEIGSIVGLRETKNYFRYNL